MDMSACRMGTPSVDSISHDKSLFQRAGEKIEDVAIARQEAVDNLILALVMIGNDPLVNVVES